MLVAVTGSEDEAATILDAIYRAWPGHSNLMEDCSLDTRTAMGSAGSGPAEGIQPGEKRAVFVLADDENAAEAFCSREVAEGRRREWTLHGSRHASVIAVTTNSWLATDLGLPWPD